MERWSNLLKCPKAIGMKTKPLYPYQQRVSEFARDRSRVGMFVFYGGGKTFLSLNWLETLDHPFPCIVLTKKSLVYQWGEEIQKHSDSSLSYVLVTGSAKQRIAKLETEAYIYVTNFDAVRSQKVFDVLNRLNFKTIIIDESTSLKEARTLRFQRLLKLFSLSRVPNRLLLSGKPITEQAEDVWSQMLFLDAGLTFGRSFWSFRNRYFSPGPSWKPYEWSLRLGASQQIADRMNTSCIRISKSEILSELPPKVYIPQYFELEEDVEILYEELRKQFRVTFPSGRKFDTQWAMVKSSKLHQIASGFIYLIEDDLQQTEILSTTKLDWIEENLPLLLETGPSLIWSCYTGLLKMVAAVLNRMSIPYEIILGEMNAESRNQRIQRFTQGEIDILLLSEPACHAGLNLQRACNSIFVSTGYSAEQRENAEDRCHRIGSEVHKNVTYYDLITKDTIDEVVLRALREKANVAEAILEHIRKE